MSTATWPVYSPFAKEHFGRGLAEGEAKGEANAIMLVLQARGLSVTAEERVRIAGCNNLDQLNRWVARAAVVETIAELFADTPAPETGLGR